MAENGIKEAVKKNPNSMANGLPSTQELKTFDHCCGIHGAARERAGLKHAKVTARRRLDKEIIQEMLVEMEESFFWEELYEG